MGRLNRDVVAAVLLLGLTIAFYAATYAIRKTNYSSVGSEVWPRAVLILLGALCLVYLVNALRGVYPPGERAGAGGLAGWFHHYRNAICCFVLYGLFLATLPYLGMLIGGILFVFLVLNSIGGWSPGKMAVHALIAAGTIGAMWAVFTFGLQVFLPEGEILQLT